jgi:hypothetical protein
VRCPVCTIRVGPCVDERGAPMAQYHDARVRAEAIGRIDHALLGALLVTPVHAIEVP